MTPGEPRPGCDRADAERIWAEYLSATAGEGWQRRPQNRHVVEQFLTGLCADDPSGCQRLVIDEPRVRDWMIRDVAGQSPASAAERLAVLDRFFRVLAEAGQIEAHPLAGYRTGHRLRSWRRLVRALQAEDPRAALTDLYPPPEAAGPLASHVRSYTDLQRALGKGIQRQQATLKDLDQFFRLHAVDLPRAATPALIEDWLDTRIGCALWRAQQIRLVHRFFGHLHALGVVTHNPAAALRIGLKRLPPTSFRPFLFSEEQVRAILAEARRLPDHHRCSCRAQICTTMLTLLSALGLRHGEVRRLRIHHVDLARQTLLIDRSKFYKSRYVPFGPKVGRCLQEYLEMRSTLLPPVREDDRLFVTKWRKPVCSQMLLNAFRDILGTLGIAGNDGQHAPRLHDLRHAFAVRCLLRWYRDGVDVQGRLPALATFLGHVDPEATQVYLSITAELLREANARFHRHFGSSFDEEAPQ
jgi:site-specific recombinase XerD